MLHEAPYGMTPADGSSFMVNTAPDLYTLGALNPTL